MAKERKTKFFTEMDVEIGQIHVPEILQRKTVDDDRILELADSIRRIGLINRITLYKEGDEYVLIAGYRRYLAHIKIGAELVPAKVMWKADKQIEAITFDENYQREDIGLVDEARWFQEIIDSRGLTQVELCKRLNRSEAYVSDHLKILQFPTSVLDALGAKLISLAVAQQLARCIDPLELQRMLTLIVTNGATASIVRNWVDQANMEMKSKGKDLKEDDFFVAGESTYKAPQMFCDLCEGGTDYQNSKFIRVCVECFQIASANLKAERKRRLEVNQE